MAIGWMGRVGGGGSEYDVKSWIWPVWAAPGGRETFQEDRLRPQPLARICAQSRRLPSPPWHRCCAVAPGGSAAAPVGCNDVVRCVSTLFFRTKLRIAVRAVGWKVDYPTHQKTAADPSRGMLQEACGPPNCQYLRIFEGIGWAAYTCLSMGLPSFLGCGIFLVPSSHAPF